MQTLYTVFLPENTADARSGLTLREAMREILTHDGREFEIRQSGDSYDLWSRDPGARWIKTVVYSFADSLDTATDEIAEKVIAAEWRRHPLAMPDDDWRALMADIARQNADSAE